MRRLLDKIQAGAIKAGLYVLIVAGFFLAGFGPEFFLGLPSIGIAMAVAGIIPFGSTARSLGRALGRGVVLGAIAGVGLTLALGIARQGDLPGSHAAVHISFTAILSTAVAGLFFRLAQRRKRLIDDQWK